MTRVCIVGALGRMGRAIASSIGDEQDMVVAAGVEHPGHRSIGEPFGQGILEPGLDRVLDRADVVVDFSLPAGLAGRARATAAAGKPYVSGITGITEPDREALRAAACRVPVVYAPNFSVGVSLLYSLVTYAARLLGMEYDIEITEIHYRAKRDAPSGTARHIVDLVRAARPGTLPVYGREGVTGPRPPGQVGVHSLRMGGAIGEHTVAFGGNGELVELTHRASSRAAFASGVKSAARFALKAEPGLYGMHDVLGIRDAEPLR